MLTTYFMQFLKGLITFYLSKTLTITVQKKRKNYKLIKSLHKGGLGYRKIAEILNERGIKTKNDKKWTNGLVHSVLKRYSERKERLAFREKQYPLVRGKMWKEFTR